MKVVLNLGLGVDSSAIAHRWLTDPASRDFSLRDLAVVTSMVGDEFTDTARLVETHLLPLFRRHAVRYVQLARSGPRVEDGITVLSDTRSPDVLHVEGVYRLSDELLAAGTGPQVAARRCSQKYKGWVIDTWLAREFGGSPYRQAMGFNADEQGRIDRDRCYGGDNRRAEYPLMTWGWGRAACEAYLLGQTGEPWVKSACVQCPFSNGRPEVLARYRAMPELAARALLLEYVAVALNPRMTLYRDRSLLSCLVKDGNGPALRAFADLLKRQTWALYRVRRVYTAKGRADRSVEKLAVGAREAMNDQLAARCGPLVERDATLHVRAWLTRRQEGVYPTWEEMLVVAPGVVVDKAAAWFESSWGNLALSVC